MSLRAAAATALAGLLFVAAESQAQSVAGEIDKRVEALRQVKPGQDAKTMASYNAAMDEAWKYFDSHRAEALPRLRERLSGEIRSAVPSPLALLDVAAYLHRFGTPEDKRLAVDALLRIDVDAPLMRENESQLFDLMHRVAVDGDRRVAALAVRAYLGRDASVVVPAHALKLDSTLLAVFVLGPLGSIGEDAARGALQAEATRRRALETLGWIGSPASYEDVAHLLEAKADYRTFVRGFFFMMSVAGPAGRDFVLGLDAGAFEPHVAEYLEKMRPQVRALGYPVLERQLESLGASQTAGPEVIRSHLAEMKRNAGREDELMPATFLKSALPATELVPALLEARQATFSRLSDEALSDVKVTNLLINALRYRPRSTP